MITGLLLALLLIHSGNIIPEEDPFVFKPPELSRIAHELAGSESNWPIVFHAADYRSGENVFSLDADSRAAVSVFLDYWKLLEEDRREYSRLIEKGAGVFAAEEVRRADSVYQAYRAMVDRGDIEESIRLISDYRRYIDDIESALENNRVVDVEARLSEKQGTVEYRRGLIGQWLAATVGKLFKEADGVRTASESTGKVTFLDGSEVELSKNSTAIIRSSRLDRLTNISDVEINISEGGLIARLSSDGIERSSYQISAGTATMMVKSSNFWAEKTDEDRVVMANYSGRTTVTAENEVIDLGRNQGTIVVRGRVPVPPVDLLPPPRFRWAATDSVIIRDRLALRWYEIPGAQYYELEISDSPSFDGWVRSINSETNQNTITDIPVGISHVRIRAYDSNDLRGADSPTYRILRSTGMLPPYLFLVDGDLSEIYTSEAEHTLSGVVEPGSDLSINGQSVDVTPAGDFNLTLGLTPGKNQITLIAANEAGNVTRQFRSITKISEDQLFDITWSSYAVDDRVRHADDILVTGRAYPPLEVVARTGDMETVVPCGINGNWALTLSPEKDSELVISLRYRDNKEIIGERTYRIE